MTADAVYSYCVAINKQYVWRHTHILVKCKCFFFYVQLELEQSPQILLYPPLIAAFAMLHMLCSAVREQ